MKVFLSHAISDKSLITKLKNRCGKNGIELLVAEHHVAVDSDITSKIKKLIDQAQIVLFLLTDGGANSKFVNQEIGYAESVGLPKLFLVEKGQKVTGFAHGADSIEFDPLKPESGMKAAIERLLLHMKKIEKDKATTAAVLIGAILAIVLLSGD